MLIPKTDVRYELLHCRCPVLTPLHETLKGRCTYLLLKLSSKLMLQPLLSPRLQRVLNELDAVCKRAIKLTWLRQPIIELCLGSLFDL